MDDQAQDPTAAINEQVAEMLAFQHQCHIYIYPTFHVWMKLLTSVPVMEAIRLVASCSAFDAEIAVNCLTDAAEEQGCEPVYAYFAACAKAE
eukprot:985626-Pyramimonas_sp.AAC.1